MWNDIIYHLDPYSYIEIKMQDTYFEYQIKSSSFPFAISLVDFDNNKLDYTVIVILNLI